MGRQRKSWLLALLIVTLHTLHTPSASMAQVRRYEPSRPTVSPYLNLFRNDGLDNRFLPNYHSLVRPLQQQQRANQTQQRLLQRQTQAIEQLQSNVQGIQQRQAAGPLVAPTGKGSWFARPGTRAKFMDTSRFYSQSGAAPRR